MADFDHIGELVALASDQNHLQTAQRLAAQKLLAYDGEIYPHDGCAITLCTLMQEAGIVISDIYQALSLGTNLRDRRN